MNSFYLLKEYKKNLDKIKLIIVIASREHLHGKLEMFLFDKDTSRLRNGVFRERLEVLGDDGI
jgi:hypothetical protein